jgi:hypothetical protein
VSASRTAGGPRRQPTRSRRRRSRQRRTALIALVAVALLGLLALLLQSLLAPEPKPRQALVWSEDNGSGIAYAVGLDERGAPVWRCTREAGRVECLGRGRADVGAGSTARSNVITQLHPADLVIRHDPDWHCYQPGTTAYLCLHN